MGRLQSAALLLGEAQDDSPFGRADGWRSAAPARPPLVHVAEPDGTSHAVTVDPEGNHADATARGRRVWATWQGQTWVLEQADAMRRTAASAAGDADVVAPMPGAVVALDVQVGDAVTAGQRLGAV